jgi:hypothetical protein
MRYSFPISEITDESPSVLGGKAHSLARMIRAGDTADDAQMLALLGWGPKAPGATEQSAGPVLMTRGLTRAP